MRKRNDKRPLRYERKPTPIRNTMLAISVTCLCWCIAVGYGLHTGHVAYYPVVKYDVTTNETQPVKLSQADDWVTTLDKGRNRN